MTLNLIDAHGPDSALASSRSSSGALGPALLSLLARTKSGLVCA